MKIDARERNDVTQRSVGTTAPPREHPCMKSTHTRTQAGRQAGKQGYNNIIYFQSTFILLILLSLLTNSYCHHHHHTVVLLVLCVLSVERELGHTILTVIRRDMNACTLVGTKLIKKTLEQNFGGRVATFMR